MKGYLRSSLCLVLVFVPSLYDEILAIIIAYYRFKHRHTISEIEFCIEKSLLCIRCWTKLIFDIKLKYWSKKEIIFSAELSWIIFRETLFSDLLQQYWAILWYVYQPNALLSDISNTTVIFFFSFNNLSRWKFLKGWTALFRCVNLYTALFPNLLKNTFK